MQMAEKKVWAHLWYCVAMRRQSLSLAKRFSTLWSLAIEYLVVGIRSFPASARRNAGFDALGDERLPEPGAVLAAIGDKDVGWREGVQHETGAFVVTHLTF